MTTALDTEHFKQRLLDEQRRVKEALDYIHEENRGQLEDDREEIPSDNHPGDMATSTFDRELDATLEGNEERLLQAIDAALERIEHGTYGICPKCGQPIPEERLEALPWTTRCIDCKRREERR
ncbi:MAG TPA: TraR/DksA C4-type zinc finger protein [Gaiellaceae bacterium]|nr:TraR/DksA C4-type zinc finger protein [Gaiellaceae bacterium]